MLLAAPRLLQTRAPFVRSPSTKTRAMASIERFEVGKRMSEASKFGGVVHLAGQVADDATQDISGQTKQILAQIDRLLANAGTDKKHLLMVQVFLKDISTFAAFNAVYDTWVVEGHTPPRATVEAKLAGPEWLIEIVVVAAATGAKL